MTPTDLRAALRDLLTDRDEYDGDRLSRIEAGLRALADALPVTPADLPAAERCPRCNDPCCDVPASTAATNGIPGFGEMCSEDDDAKWAALGRDWRARALAAEADAARWAKVAPLIERLRGHDGRPLYTDIMTLLAATEAAP